LRCKVRKKRTGRPLKTGKPLTKRVELRMSDAEYRKLEQKAKAKGLSISEFLRECGED
jgi:predicted DNA binding CopG/RHH family protein